MPSRTLRPLPTLLAVAAAGLGLTACGESTIASDEVEDTITKQFASRGVPLTDVSCDGEVEAKVDAPISCTGLNPSETTLKLEGKVTAVDDGKATFRVVAVSGVAKGPTVAAQALALLERKVGEKAKGLTCPDEVPLPTKPSVTCELTTQDGKRFDATLKIDAQSRIEVEVADTPKG